MTLRTLFAAILGIVSIICAYGADDTNYDYTFNHIKIADGLPHQQVQTMAFDHIGRLWIGTRNGLACYDGYTFKTYYHIPGDDSSLCDNFIIHLLVDSRGNIWVGTEKGLCRYLHETDSFRTYDVGDERVGSMVETKDGRIVIGANNMRCLLPGEDSFRLIPRQGGGYIVSMAVSPDNRIFVATNETIASFDSSLRSVTYLDSVLYKDFFMGFDEIVPMFFDRDGHMWIGRNGKGVMRLDRKSGDTKIYDESQLTDGTVRAIAQDPEGKIWVGTEKGINVINPQTDKIVRIQQDFVNSKSLNDNAIYCIVPDMSGNMWIGTYFGGINLVKDEHSKFNWLAPGYKEYDLRGKAIRRIVEPEPGTLWLATEDGSVNILDMASGRVTPFAKNHLLGVNVHELYYDREKEEMWIGTFRNGLFRYDMRGGGIKQYLTGQSGLGSDAIFSIVGQPHRGGGRRLFIGTTHGLRYYEPDKDTFEPINSPILDTDFVYSMLVEKDGSLWVGTVNNGLFRIDGDTGSVKGWSTATDSNSDSELRDLYITALHQGADGTIWIGTNNGELHLLEPGKDAMRRYHTTTDPNEFGTICSINADKNGLIWVSTSKGLFSIDKSSRHPRHFTTADGLPENQFNFSSSHLGSDGKMYFGTVNGLVSFRPDIKKGKGAPQDIHLWELSINNEPVGPGSEDSPLMTVLDVVDELKLSHSDSRIFTIFYGIVNPASADATNYQVLMEGIDKNWRDVGQQRSFTAMDLAPGTYRLRIRAASDSEEWDTAPVRELVIKIAPPFYLSVWAFITYLILLGIISYVIWHFMKIRIQEKNAIKISRMEKEKSEELNRDKMEFFTNISHELKTPLSLILAPLKYISKNQPLTHESTKQLDVAIANTNKMVGLIDELVTFNRVESGNFQLYLQKGNPLTFIETMCGYFHEAAKEKQIAIQVSTEDNGEKVWFSTAYLERILYNLLSNAIKYTAQGGQIAVRAAIKEGDDNNIHLRFEVRDNGIGIAPEELDNIFRKYYQTKRGYNTNHQGWGIGLATVKKLVDIHKGSISVTSEMGKGSCFTVSLNVTADAFEPQCRIDANAASSPEPPYTRTINTALTSPRNHESTNSSDKISILIVEDNPDLLEFLVESFVKTYNVYTATDGHEALTVAAEHHIDIVVSDVMMPKMDGITLCEHLKNDIATSHIPVILLTAKNDEDSIMRGFEAGAAAYVAKPFDPQILELRIKNIIRSRSRYLNSIINPDKADGLEETKEDETEMTPIFNKYDKEFITHMNEFVEANLENSEFAISDITREFGISRSLLHVKMRSLFNASMTDFIRHKRMVLACSLLQSGMNVSETAYKVGFSDPNYFSKVFKKEFGVTPTEFISRSDTPA